MEPESLPDNVGTMMVIPASQVINGKCSADGLWCPTCLSTGAVLFHGEYRRLCTCVCVCVCVCVCARTRRHGVSVRVLALFCASTPHLLEGCSRGIKSSPQDLRIQLRPQTAFEMSWWFCLHCVLCLHSAGWILNFLLLFDKEPSRCLPKAPGRKLDHAAKRP